MKYKTDFVTNSSSASFIMTFRTYSDMDLENFIKVFNDFLESQRNRYFPNIRHWDALDVKKITNNIFQITEWTSMYNDQSDVPDYMKYFLIEKILDKGFFEDFKIEDFRVEHGN